MSNAEAVALEASSARVGGAGMYSPSSISCESLDLESNEGDCVRENLVSLVLDLGEAEAALLPSLCRLVGGELVTVETAALVRVIGGSP